MEMSKEEKEARFQENVKNLFETNAKKMLENVQNGKAVFLPSEKVLERDFILDSVWGENYGETRTLDIHIGDLRRLLASSQAEITTIRGVGYVLK